MKILFLRRKEIDLYQFADISHHKGALDFANLGHRIVVSKASDNDHLPDVSGKYGFFAERHFDSRQVEEESLTLSRAIKDKPDQIQ